jgi:rubrerythrin
MADRTLEEPRGREGAPVALPEGASSRRGLLAGAGGAGAMAAFLSACANKKRSTEPETAPANPPASKSQFGEGDVGILNFALTIEYLELDFYHQAIRAGKLKGRAHTLLSHFGEQEREHVDLLRSTVEQVGGSPAKRPKGRFPLGSAQAILSTATAIESVGAAAYLGQVGNFGDPQLLQAALTIHTVEARHAATLASLMGQPVSPEGAFAKPQSVNQVVAALKPFMVL